MDRQGISSPVFHDNDIVNNYITKTSIFRLQMQGIEQLAIDIRQNEARIRDYLDTKLAEQRDQVRDMVANYKSSSPSSSSRRRRSSGQSSERHRAQSLQHHQYEDARDASTYKSQKALHQATAKLHEHKRRLRDKHQQDGATTTTTTSASSPSVIKASSPLDIFAYLNEYAYIGLHPRRR